MFSFVAAWLGGLLVDWLGCVTGWLVFVSDCLGGGTTKRRSSAQALPGYSPNANVCACVCSWVDGCN